MKNNQHTKKMVLSALFAALTAVATMIHFHFPGAQTGYVNLGDCLVIASGVLLGPVYGGAAAGIGAALTDFIHGYTVYVLPTFLIKALMAAAVSVIFRSLNKNKNTFGLIPLIISGIVSELIMIGGYYLYEGLFIVDFAGAALGIPGNILQGITGIVTAIVLLKVMKKTKIYDMLK